MTQLGVKSEFDW